MLAPDPMPGSPNPQPMPVPGPPRPSKEHLRDRLVGWFLDGVLWFSVASLILAVSGLGAAIIDDVRTIAGW